MGSMTESFSIDQPTVSAVRHSTFADTMPVFAVCPLGFFSAKVRAAATECQSTIWQSQSSLTCRPTVTAGSGKDKAVVLTVGSQAGSLTAALSMDRAAFVISTASSSNVANDQQRVILNGRGFISHTVAAVLGSTAPEQSRWLSHTGILALSGRASGLGGLSLPLFSRYLSLSSSLSLSPSLSSSLSLKRGAGLPSEGCRARYCHGCRSRTISPCHTILAPYHCTPWSLPAPTAHKLSQRGGNILHKVTAYHSLSAFGLVLSFFINPIGVSGLG